MLSRIRWQVFIAGLSVILVVALLVFASLDRTTVVVPEKGVAYIEGVVGGYRYLNPILAQHSRGDMDLCSLIFSGLTKVDDRGQIVADLAESWEVSADGLVYTLHLRPGVVWQDGHPFSADDVLFTIRAIQASGYQGSPILSSLWQDIHAEKLDEQTVEFALEEPFAPFLDYTTLGLLPAHLLGGVPPEELPGHPFNLNPVGTGPFRVQEAAPDRIRLVANPSYYGPNPYLESVDFRFYSDWPSLLAAYGRGEVEGLSEVAAKDLAEVKNEKGLNIYSARFSSYALLFLNLRNPLFQEKEVRQALLLALDRQAIVDEALGGQALVLDSPIPLPSWAHFRKVRTYGYDPEAAKVLLEASGWRDGDGDGIREKGGVKLEFALLTNDEPARMRAVSLISQQLAKIGAKANPQVASSAKLIPDFLRPRLFDALLYEWRASGPDPDPYPLWHSTQGTDEGQNFAGYQNKEVDLILEQARQATDQELRRRLYYRFQEIFAEEVPSLLLYSQVYSYAVDETVKDVQLGFLVDPSDRFRSIAQWYVKTKRLEAKKAGAGGRTG